MAKKRNWNVVFHILPEDIDKANNLVGYEIARLLSNSRDILKKRYHDKVIFVDNLELLDASYFYEVYPTEHYKSEGKMLVSKSIAQSLKKVYPNDFVDIKWKVHSKSEINKADLIIKINKIKSDSLWFSMVKHKSVKLSISLDSMLYIDAKWAVEQDQLKLQTNFELKIIIDKIKSDTAWYRLIKEKALKNNISIEEQTLLDAKWLVENP